FARFNSALMNRLALTPIPSPYRSFLRSAFEVCRNMEVFWRPTIANACDRNLSQVADNAALPLLRQAKNLSLAQLFRMLESGARFGERLRQLTRSQRRDCVTIGGQSEKQWRRESILFRAQTGSGSKEHYAK